MNKELVIRLLQQSINELNDDYNNTLIQKIDSGIVVDKNLIKLKKILDKIIKKLQQNQNQQETPNPMPEPKYVTYRYSEYSEDES